MQPTGQIENLPSFDSTADPMETDHMTDTTVINEVVAMSDTADGHPVTTPTVKRPTAALSYRRIGAVYVWIAIIVLFTALEPATFATISTGRTILNNFAIGGLLALGLVVPLSAGLFDVSVGYVAGVAGIFSAYAVSAWDLNGATAIALTIVLCVLIGCFNGFVISVLKVDSLIGTLATGSLFLALNTALSNEQSITHNVDRLKAILSQHYVLSVTIPVVALVILALIIEIVMERTVLGRYWYAIGYDIEVARLSGLPVRLLQVSAMVVSAVVAGIAGMLLTARVGSGVPSAGPSYLLPAFAAAFLGSTQLRGGRFNAPGTVIAVYMIGTGSMGLSLAGAPTWSTQIFQGVVLIAAIALTRSRKAT